MGYRWYYEAGTLDHSRFFDKFLERVRQHGEVAFFPCFADLPISSKTTTVIAPLACVYPMEFIYSEKMEQRVNDWVSLGRSLGCDIVNASIQRTSKTYNQIGKTLVHGQEDCKAQNLSSLVFTLNHIDDSTSTNAYKGMWISAFFMRYLVERTNTVDTFWWLKENYGHKFPDISDVGWLAIAEQTETNIINPLPNFWDKQLHRFLLNCSSSIIVSSFVGGPEDSLAKKHFVAANREKPGFIYRFDDSFNGAVSKEIAEKIAHIFLRRLNRDNLEEYLTKFNKAIQLHKEDVLG